MKTKSIILAALCALAASALADEFRYSFSGVMNKRITSGGTDQLTSINGPTDFNLSFTLNYLNDGGVYTLQGFSDISVSVADWLFRENALPSHQYKLTPNGSATDLFLQSDSKFAVRTSIGWVVSEGFEIFLRGLSGTNPNDIPGFTDGSVWVWGYSFDDRPCDYLLTGTLSPVADAGSVLPLLLAGVTALFVSRRCLLRWNLR
jgi:hypothetical protein